MAWNVSEGCHLKADYWKVIMRGGILFPDTCDCMSHITTRTTQVLLSGTGIIVTSLFAQIHYLGNRKVRKLLIKDVPTLWLLQAVCRHLKPSVSSPLKEKYKKKQKTATYWSADRGRALHDNNLTPPQRGKRRGERKKKTGRKQHTRTHLKIYLHILSTRWAHIWCLLVIGVYQAFVGFCWGAVRHLVPTQRERRCQLCSLARSTSPTQND